MLAKIIKVVAPLLEIELDLRGAKQVGARKLDKLEEIQSSRKRLVVVDTKRKVNSFE